MCRIGYEIKPCKVLEVFFSKNWILVKSQYKVSFEFICGLCSGSGFLVTLSLAKMQQALLCQKLFVTIYFLTILLKDVSTLCLKWNSWEKTLQTR